MAAPGISFKAVGASLDTLAKRCQELPRGSRGAIAYANSGVLQQAGEIVRSRYIVAGPHADVSPSGYTRYKEPPGATHGPVVMAWKQKGGEAFRDQRGQFQKRPIEIKLFVKGKFVDRSGAMLGAADDVRAATPSEQFPRVIVREETAQYRKHGEISVGIDDSGLGYVQLSDGYAAAERGTRSRLSSPVRGWWRGLRTASTQWGKLLNKKYPDLLKLGSK